VSRQRSTGMLGPSETNRSVHREPPCLVPLNKRAAHFKLRAVHPGTGRNRQKIAREIVIIGFPLRSKRHGHQSGILGIGVPLLAINFGNSLDISRDEATSPASQKEGRRGNLQLLELSRMIALKLIPIPGFA
jgi:hypothetical protein